MIKLLKKIYILVAATLLYISMLAICKTLRIDIKGRETYDEMKKAGKNVIFAVWHQATFIMFYVYRGLGAYIFVTSELRGQVLAKCAEWMGFHAIPIHLDKQITMARSTAKLLSRMEKGHDVVVAVDGPKGPPGEIKPGIFYLSTRANVPIFPAGVKAPWKITLFWRWDKYFIPLPFSKVTLSLSAPVLPEEIKRVDLKKVLERIS